MPVLVHGPHMQWYILQVDYTGTVSLVTRKVSVKFISHLEREDGRKRRTQWPVGLIGGRKGSWEESNGAVGACKQCIVAYTHVHASAVPPFPTLSHPLLSPYLSICTFSYIAWLLLFCPQLFDISRSTACASSLLSSPFLSSLARATDTPPKRLCLLLHPLENLQ